MFEPTALCLKCDHLFTYHGVQRCLVDSYNEDPLTYYTLCYHGTEGYFNEDGEFVEEELQQGKAI